jgi:hypothetical protein
MKNMQLGTVLILLRSLFSLKGEDNKLKTGS